MLSTLSALLTPVVAILGCYIAYQQWKTSNLKLKFDLFDRRLEKYEAIYSFIADLLINGRLHLGSDVSYLKDTKSLQFLFDKEISAFAEAVYKKAAELDGLAALNDGLSGDAASANRAAQREIKEWLQVELRGMKQRFSPYLSLSA